ncbi:MAG TPA: PAS domain S-box protein [Spongiibacteraceae bacterium]|jgi:PAS domain S-box-containing protein
MIEPAQPKPPFMSATVSDADYRLMVEEVGDYAIMMLDPSGFIASWNAGGKRLKGYSADEIIGQHFSVFYPPELLARHWPEHELKMAREIGRFEDEGWRVRKDGTRFWASVIITRLTDEHGTLRGFSKITRDLSDRRRHEELLRLSEERFRLLVEGVKDYAIYMLDPAGHVASWNSGARQTKGYQASEIIGKHFSIFYPADVAATGWPDKELKKALEEGRYEEEGWRVRKDGSRFWANCIITPLFDASERLYGFAKVTRDLTEKRRVSTLEDEGRRITTFIAMLAHELRNPLAPISNALAILRLEPHLPPAVEAANDIIARQLKQLTRLVNDLLDVNRIALNKLHLETKAVALESVIAEAIETIAPLLAENEQTLDADFRGCNLWVKGDRARLVQIIGNVLHNAAKFTQRNGHIEIYLHADNQQASIVIKDNGPGIAPERIPLLFNRFSQIEDDAQKIFGGLGLGLSLAQQLAMLQGGKVQVFSTGIAGEGSEFVISFPSIAPPQENTSAALSKTVLVVDDNHDSADTMALLLENLGYRSIIAYDGLQALAAIRQHSPQVVLLDIGLPGMDGIEVAQRINAEFTTPPTLIAVTGYGMEKDRMRSFTAGFQAHLTKPVDQAVLTKALHVSFM